MTESFILDFIPKRMKQLDFSSWHIAYRDLVLKGGASLVVPAFNELWFVVGDPPDLIISSDYGVYNGSAAATHENTHEHRGLLLIKNNNNGIQRIKFIQAIIIS